MIGGSTAKMQKWKPSHPNGSPDSPLQKKAWQSHIKIKTMLTVYFDWEHVVHHNYVPPGQAINEEYYLNCLH